MEKRPDILSDAAQQESFYQSSKAWIEALAERNGLVGKLGVLPNDPERYPYQRLDVGFVRASRPAAEESANEPEVQAGVLELLRRGASDIIGEDNYEKFVHDLSYQALAPVPGGASNTRGEIFYSKSGTALKTFFGRVKTKNHHAALVGYHPNFMALPIYAAALVESISQMEAQNQKPFNFFDLTEQMIMPVNASLCFAAYDGTPAVETLSLLSNISLNVPPTASSRLYGIDSQLRKAINDQADFELQNHLEMLDAKSKSAILISDPTGSTAERLCDETGDLNGLRFRRIAPGAYEQLSKFNFAWPVTMWWEEDPKAAKWFVGNPTPVGDASSSGKLVYGLAAETGKLAGVDVYFGKNKSPLGQVALEATI